MLDNYGPQNPVANEAAEVVCRNCGRTRYAVRLVARLLPRDEQGRHYTEVCHECLNEETLSRRRGKPRT